MLGRVVKGLCVAFGVISVAAWLAGPTIEKGFKHLSVSKKTVSPVDTVPAVVAKVALPVFQEASIMTPIKTKKAADSLPSKAVNKASVPAAASAPVKALRKTSSASASSPASIKPRRSVCVKISKQEMKRLREEEDIDSAFSHGKRAYPVVVKRFGKIIESISLAKGIDPDLEAAKVCVESGGDPNNRSRKGAIGLDQLMPGTGDELLSKRGILAKNGKELDSLLRVPEISIHLGTDHFVRSMRMFNCPVKSLVGYEIGDAGVSSRIKNYGRAEDVPYYEKVFLMYRWIKEQKGELPDLAMTPPTRFQTPDPMPIDSMSSETTIANGYE